MALKVSLGGFFSMGTCREFTLAFAFSRSCSSPVLALADVRGSAVALSFLTEGKTQNGGCQSQLLSLKQQSFMQVKQPGRPAFRGGIVLVRLPTGFGVNCLFGELGVRGRLSLVAFPLFWSARTSCAN